MDPAKQISELEAKISSLKAERDALEQQLAVPGIDKAKDHDIRQQMIALNNQITTYADKLPPPPDHRSVWKRGWDSIVEQPVIVGGPALS